MTGEKKTSATILMLLAIFSVAVIFLVLASTAILGYRGSEPVEPVAGNATCRCSAYESTFFSPSVVLPLSACTALLKSGPATRAAQETVQHATIILKQPDRADLVPYTVRQFSAPVTASIAWWMYPGFDNENREFRRFLRSTQEEQLQYPEEERIFFTETARNLDAAEESSTLSGNVTLYRGITVSVADIVLNSSVWIEQPFSSTSYDISVTLDPYGTRDPEGYLNVLVLPGQKGDHVVYLNEDQREFLLPRGTAWKVTGVENVRSLDVSAGFPLHNRTENTASFPDVRLIYLADTHCA